MKWLDSLIIVVMALVFFVFIWMTLMTDGVGSCLGTIEQCASSLHSKEAIIKSSPSNLLNLALSSIALSIGLFAFSRVTYR